MCQASSHERTKRPIARAVHWTYKVTISWMFTGACRFSPPCSNYALEAIEVHGWVRGLYLGARRILRCHPFNPGGFDPVP